MVRLSFYGGVNEIGGNKILLEDKEMHILLDFGQSFAFGSARPTPQSLSAYAADYKVSKLPK